MGEDAVRIAMLVGFEPLLSVVFRLLFQKRKHVLRKTGERLRGHADSLLQHKLVISSPASQKLAHASVRDCTRGD